MMHCFQCTVRRSNPGGHGSTRADKPPLGSDTDHNATKQDCRVHPYVDTAFAKVAANHPGLVTVAPKFEAHACAAKNVV